MANQLSKTGITTGNTVRSGHVTQSIDAFNGTEAYDITLSGSLTYLDGTEGDDKILVTNTSGQVSSTSGITGSFTGSFAGDGTNITGLPNISGTDKHFLQYNTSVLPTGLIDSPLSIDTLGGATPDYHILSWKPGDGTIGEDLATIQVENFAGTARWSMIANGSLQYNNASFVGSILIDTNNPLTAIRDWDMPDASGTVALLNDLIQEGYTESGTRAGLDMYVGLGDYDDSGDGTKIIIDDNLGEITIFGQTNFPGGDIVLTDGGGLKLDATGFVTTLQGNNITATRDVEMPDASGTIALTNNLLTEMSFAASDGTTPIVVANDIGGMFATHDMTIQSVFAGVGIVGTTSGVTNIDIKVNGTSILGTAVTIDFGEATSLTAATPPFVDTPSISKGDRISIDIDAITTGGTEAGLQITLNGIRA